MVVVNYFFDPMCAWCFGAAPLIETIVQESNFQLIFRPGGMIPRREINSDFRQHILRADQQIEAQAKLQFGQAYKTRVASNEVLILDSYITTQAFLVGQKMGVESHIMLKAIQEAHYIKGEAVEEPFLLKGIALNLGLDGREWDRQMASSESQLLEEIEKTQVLMKRFNLTGFPSLVAEVDGENISLPMSRYYGDAPAWKQFLRGLIE